MRGGGLRRARRHREAAEAADQDIHGLDDLVILCRHHHNVETAAERDLSWHDIDPEDLPLWVQSLFGCSQ